MYDKTAEMASKGTDWWEEVWGDSHQEGAQVWRIEFEIGRTALTELELYHPDAVLAAVPSMWRYCTGEWLTLRTPGPDSNSSRWPVAAPWSSIQAATLAHGATELAWIRRRKRASSFRRLMPGLVGYLVSFAALSGTFTVADTLEALTAHLADDEIARRRPQGAHHDARRCAPPGDERAPHSAAGGRTAHPDRQGRAFRPLRGPRH